MACVDSCLSQASQQSGLIIFWDSKNCEGLSSRRPWLISIALTQIDRRTSFDDQSVNFFHRHLSHFLYFLIMGSVHGCFSSISNVSEYSFDFKRLLSKCFLAERQYSNQLWNSRTTRVTFLVWEVHLCYDVFLNALACRQSIYCIHIQTITW